MSKPSQPKPEIAWGTSDALRLVLLQRQVDLLTEILCEILSENYVNLVGGYAWQKKRIERLTGKKIK